MTDSNKCYARAHGNCGTPRGQREDFGLRVHCDTPVSLAGLRRAVRDGGVFAPRVRWMGWGYARWLRKNKHELLGEGVLGGWVPFTIQYRARACFDHAMEEFGLYAVRDESGEMFFVDAGLRFGNGIRAVGLRTVPHDLPEED